MTCNGRRQRQSIVLIAACLLILAGCSANGINARPGPVPEFHPGYLIGYLPADGLPNSLSLLPPPPIPGSAAHAVDDEVARKSLAVKGTDRYSMAVSDYDLMFPHAAGTFSCAVSAPITEDDTPYLYVLLRRVLTDAILSTRAAKRHYNRKRPFVVNGEPVCVPGTDGHLKNDGSFPSGHTAGGWAWALILSEIAPDRADAVLARGMSFGASRTICNHHWLSDVVAGRVMGAATVARLHADPVFTADLARAKAEYTRVRAMGLRPVRDCAREDAALSLLVPSSP